MSPRMTRSTKGSSTLWSNALSGSSRIGKLKSKTSSKESKSSKELDDYGTPKRPSKPGQVYSYRKNEKTGQEGKDDGGGESEGE